MADAASGLERSLETTQYSPAISGDRLPADRAARSGLRAIEPEDGPHSDLESLLKLGTIRLEAGNNAEAAEFFRKALDMGERSFGPDHPDLTILLNDLTRLYLKQSDYASAEPLLLRLLELKRSKGEDHPEVATVLASLATVRQALGRHESAEQLWRRVLEIRERTLAPNHFATATALERLGDTCAARGKIREALAAFERALTIRERTLGGEHPSLRTSRERIADLELQASEDSLNASAEPAPTPERYRLLSGGEPTGTGATAQVAPEKTAPPSPRKATLMIPRSPVSEPIARQSAASEAAESIDSAPQLQSTTVPYLEALASIRDEVEDSYDSLPFTERPQGFLGSVVTLFSNRMVAGGVAAGVIALLLVGALAESRAWTQPDVGAAATGSAPGGDPAREITPAVAASSPLTASDLAANAAAGSAASKADAPRSHVTEDRSTTRKSPEKKSESRSDGKIAIPTVSTAMMSRLDSVATRTANASTRAGEALSAQPAPSAIVNQRSTFDYGDQGAAAQRARLIGDLPTPRIPAQVADVEGDVRVSFTVDTAGHPVMATFAVVTSPHPLLTTAVRQVIAGMRFEPARSGGVQSKPIVDVVQLGYRFAKQGR